MIRGRLPSLPALFPCSTGIVIFSKVRMRPPLLVRLEEIEEAVLVVRKDAEAVELLLYKEGLRAVAARLDEEALDGLGLRGGQDLRGRLRRRLRRTVGRFVGPA